MPYLLLLSALLCPSIALADVPPGPSGPSCRCTSVEPVPALAGLLALAVLVRRRRGARGC